MPTCARATVAIPNNEVAYVSVEFQVEPEGSIVFFEPDPDYIPRCQAYPCPGILDAAQPTAIRLLDASADERIKLFMLHRVQCLGELNWCGEWQMDCIWD